MVTAETAPICTRHMEPMADDGECPWCEGTGDAYPDNFDLWMIRCFSCAGSGIRWRCWECDGEEADARDEEEANALTGRGERRR